MRRRYTIHQDGDLLIEELDDAGRPIEPEPVPDSQRLPFEVILSAPAGELAQGRLLELLEAVVSVESGDDEWRPAGGRGGHKLPQV
jgi:hypothetical protein